MAVATIAALLVDIDLANSGNPTLENTGHANVAQSETDLQIEGAACYACGYAGAVGSTNPATSDFSAQYSSVTAFTGANRHLGVWLRVLYPTHNKADGGLSLYLGDNTNQGLWYASGVDQNYFGGWYFFVLDIDGTSGPESDLNYGTEPAHTAFTRIGLAVNLTASKGQDFLQNQYFDAIRRSDANDDFGLRYTGGLTGDRLFLADLASADTSAYGIFTDLGGAFTVAGELHFGNAASTIYLQDSTKSVIFRDLPVASTFYKVIGNDGTTGVTNIDLQGIVWQGVSTALRFSFDMSALATGDTGVFSGSAFVFGGVVKFGAQSTADNCKFVQCTDVQPNGITINEPTFENSTAATLTVASDKVVGGATNLHNTAINVAFMTTNDLAKIENHAFDNTGGVGHAIEITAIGTYSFVGNTFAGYGADASSSAAIYNNSGGLVTINISGGGGTPTIRNGAGASTVVNNTVTVKVTVKTTGGVNIQNARVLLEADAGGDLPSGASVTITRVTTTATVAHTAHGMVNGQEVVIRGANQAEYNKVVAITNVSANAYDYAVTGTPLSPATGTITATAAILNGLTDVNGVLQDTGFNFTNVQAVKGVARKSTATPFYKSASILGSIVATTGFSTITQMVLNE